MGVGRSLGMGLLVETLRDVALQRDLGEVTCMLVQVRSDMPLQGDPPRGKNPSTVTHCETPSLRFLIWRTVLLS